MEDRHRGEHPVTRSEHWIGCDNLRCQRVKVFICKLYALVRACCTAGIKYYSCIISLHVLIIFPEACLTKLHEVMPHDHRGIFRNLLYLAAFSEHISCLQSPGHLIFDARNDDVYQIGILAYRLNLPVKLIQCNDRDTA